MHVVLLRLTEDEHIYNSMQDHVQFQQSLWLFFAPSDPGGRQRGHLIVGSCKKRCNFTFTKNYM